MRHFSFTERAPGDWDVGDRSRLFAIRTDAKSGKVYLRDERPGRTRDTPKEFGTLTEAVAAVTAILMDPECTDEDVVVNDRAMPEFLR